MRTVNLTAPAAALVAVVVFAQMPDRNEMAFHAAMKKETRNSHAWVIAA